MLYIDETLGEEDVNKCEVQNSPFPLCESRSREDDFSSKCRCQKEAGSLISWRTTHAHSNQLKKVSHSSFQI